VTVRANDNLVGCVRMIRIGEVSQSFLVKMAGCPRIEAALRTMKLTPAECAEAGRWIVAPSARGKSRGYSACVHLCMWTPGANCCFLQRWLGIWPCELRHPRPAAVQTDGPAGVLQPLTIFILIAAADFFSPGLSVGPRL
jgi:hypothetical protein